MNRFGVAAIMLVGSFVVAIIAHVRAGDCFSCLPDNGSCKGSPTGSCDSCDPLGNCANYPGITYFSGKAFHSEDDGDYFTHKPTITCKTKKACQNGDLVTGHCYGGWGCGDLEGIDTCQVCTLGAEITIQEKVDCRPAGGVCEPQY